MPKTVYVEHFASPTDTLVTLEYVQEGEKHVIRFESEDRPNPVSLAFPTKEQARDSWRSFRKILIGLGFKKFS